MTDSYVTNEAWLTADRRADGIDEVADQFERPSGALAFWTDVAVRRALRETSMGRAFERRAG